MNEKEKIAYLKALVYIATVDEQLEESEKEYLLNIAKVYGLNQEKTEELVNAVLQRKESLEDILSAITERNTKLLLVYELTALCYADGHYSNKEKTSIMNIGNILGIESDKISEIEGLFDESIKLQEKINRVLER